MLSDHSIAEVLYKYIIFYIVNFKALYLNAWNIWFLELD